MLMVFPQISMIVVEDTSPKVVALRKQKQAIGSVQQIVSLSITPTVYLGHNMKKDARTTTKLHRMSCNAQMMPPFPATEKRGISAAELSDRKMITDRVPIFLETSKLLPQTTSGFLQWPEGAQPHIVPKNDQDNPQRPSGCSKSALMVCVGVLQRVQV